MFSSHENVPEFVIVKCAHVVHICSIIFSSHSHCGHYYTHDLWDNFVYMYIYVKLKDWKRSLSGKNDHNALWHLRNCYNAKFRVVAIFKQPQHVVACEDMPWCKSRVVAVKGNDYNDYGLHENTTSCCGHYLLQPRRDVKQVSICRTVS